jgi:hypothetical protein
MKRTQFFLLLAFFPTYLFAQPNVYDKYAQKFTEIGFQAGVAGYAGDLGGPLGTGDFKNFAGGLFRPMVNINATHRMSSWAAFRPGLTVARVAGDDNAIKSGSDSDPNLGSRNLNFRSIIAELSIVADINPFYIFRGYAESEHNFYPYASIGLGAFYMNPQTNLNGTWIDLKQLRLEGQGFPQYPKNQQYSKIQISIPMGAGFKYYFGNKYYIGAEGMVRKTFTDYLDDVSTTYIDPALFDAYLSAEKASLAKELYFRNVANPSQIGGQRGNPSVDDYFFTVALRFGFVLGR